MNLVLTYYWCYERDFWHPELNIVTKQPDANEFYVLRKSVQDFPSYKFHTLTNWATCPWDHTLVRKPNEITLFVHKFIVCYEYLLEHPEYDKIWIVDTSDTQMLQDIELEEGKVYVGYDCYSRRTRRYQTVRTLVNGGFKRFKYSPEVHRSLMKWAYSPCYNCGILGGKRDTILNFLKELKDLMERWPADLEMVTFNYLLFNKHQKDIKICTTKLNNWEIPTQEELVEQNIAWRHK